MTAKLVAVLVSVALLTLSTSAANSDCATAADYLVSVRDVAPDAMAIALGGPPPARDHRSASYESRVRSACYVAAERERLAAEQAEREAEEAALAAEQATWPLAEVLAPFIYGDRDFPIVEIEIRNNHTAALMAVEIRGRAFDGFGRALGGECGRDPTVWTFSARAHERALIEPGLGGRSDLFSLQTLCWSDAVRVSFEVTLAQFADGTRWSP